MGYSMISKFTIAQCVICFLILPFVVEWQCIETLKVPLVRRNENVKGVGLLRISVPRIEERNQILARVGFGFRANELLYSYFH